MKNPISCLTYITIISIFSLLTNSSYAQTQSHLLTIPGVAIGSTTQACNMIEFGSVTHTVELPSHPFLVNGNPGNPHSESDLLAGLADMNSKYLGQHPLFAQSVVHDANGDLLFFIIDNNIYNRDGYAFEDLNNTLQPGSTLHTTDPSNSIRRISANSYYESLNSLSPDILVFPISHSQQCYTYGLVYGFIDPMENVTGNYVFYRTMKILDANTVEMSSPIHLSNYYNLPGVPTGCGNFVSMSMAASTQRPDGTRLVFVQLYDYVHVIQINSNGSLGNHFDFNTETCQAANILPTFNGEMELHYISESQPNAESAEFRVAIPTTANSDPNTSWAAFYVIDIDYSNTNGITVLNWKRVNMPKIFSNGTIEQIKGLEFSPDGKLLYITYFGQTDVHYYDIDNQTLNHLNITGGSDYEYGSIETGADGNLYFLGMDNNQIGKIARLTNPNAPSNSNWSLAFSNQIEELFYSYHYYDLPTTPTSYDHFGSTPGFKKLVFMDQIDGANYFQVYASSWVDCCNPNTDFDWPTPTQFNQNCSPVWVWEPGNNPFNNTTGIVTLDGTLEIPDGKMLTIIDMNLEFKENSKIIVGWGSQLTLDGASLTGQNPCGSFWEGITVLGKLNEPQSSTNQGKVVLTNEALIANARVGVETGKVRAAGGIIQAENAYFYNCEYGVKMHPYRNFSSNNNQITLANLSYFKNCRFVTSEDLKIPSTIPKSHIWLNGIQRIRIEGNVFENIHPTVPAGPGRGKGIEATNSVFTVRELCNTPLNPCSNGIPNTFRNLHYGIYAMATNSLTPMTVTNAIFENNSFGTYLSGITQAKVAGCEYTVPQGITTSGRVYGLYLDHCTGYTIEENYFQNGTSLTDNTVGMIVNNSGSLPNEVYNNTFNDLGYGVLTQHDNRGINIDFGLQIKCNDFSEVLQVDLGISRREDYTGITGISVYQGGNNSVTAPAGNTFSWTGSNPFSDIHNNGLVISKYFHHNMQGSTPTTGENWVPKYYNFPKVLLEEATGWYYLKSQACPLHSIQTPLNSSQLYGELSTHETNVNSANLVLNIYRDGGIPELPEMVALAYPWETYYYFNTLMLESPYLSDQTLIAAIQNTDLLPDLLLKLVLIANPQCTRSADVMATLEARDPQLPEYMMEEIMQGEDLPSPLEALEADVAYHNHLRYTTLNQIISLYLADSSTAVASDSLLQIFQRDPLIDLKYNEVFIHLQNENWEDAEGRLEALSQELVDCEYENQQYAEYTDFVPILIKMVRDSCEFWDLTTGEMDKLVELSDNGLYFPAAYARTIRLLYDSTYTYEEPIIFPVAQSARKGKAARPQLLSDAPVVQVYPNPARDYCIVDYQMDIMDVDASLHITTPQGKLLQQFTLSNPTGQKIIDLKGLADGLYYITLKTKRNLVVTRKITVAN